MNLYIYNNLPEDPVIKNLTDWRENDNISGYYAACSGLLNAFSSFREYVAAIILETVPQCGIADVKEYFNHDICEIYSYFIAFDWNLLCKNKGVLPLPDFSKHKPTDMTDLQKTINKLVRAKSSAALGDIIIKFFNRYSCADEAQYSAFKWKDGFLKGIPSADEISFDDLAVLGYKKDILIDNTEAFVNRSPANDVLLVGTAGTGKSSCIKAVFNMFKGRGLKLVELFKGDISKLPQLMDEIKKRKQQYIIYIDDLSFDGTDVDYRALKVALDGQVEKRPDNMLLYATSNRLHLIKESWKDREGEQDVRENDTLQEKMSLSERFGIRLYFQNLTQPEYFEIVALLLAKHGIRFDERIGKLAVAWEMGNNGRSGRTAKQFVTDFLAHKSDI